MTGIEGRWKLLTDTVNLMAANLTAHVRAMLYEELVGRCAYEKSRVLLSRVPADYVQISSGLGRRSVISGARRRSCTTQRKLGAEFVRLISLETYAH